MPLTARSRTSTMRVPAEDFPVSPSTNVDSQQMQASPYQELHPQSDKPASPTKVSAVKSKPHQGVAAVARPSTLANIIDHRTAQDENRRPNHLHPDGGFVSSNLSPNLASGSSPSFSSSGRMRGQLEPRRPTSQADTRVASKANWYRKASDLPSVALPVGRAAETGMNRTISGQRSRGPGSTRHFLTVVPPEDFPLERPNTRNAATAAAAASSSSYHHLRRGALLPLYPTLNGQLYAISREYSLPSIGGLSIYLCEDGDGNLGPRIGEATWEALWARFFIEEEEESGIGQSGGFSAPISPFLAGGRSRDRSASSSRFGDPRSPATATSEHHTPDLQQGPRPMADGMRRATGGSNSWRGGSPMPYAGELDNSFVTSSSTSRLAAALPIVGRVEWAVDRQRAPWWSKWAGEGEELPAPRSVTPSRQQRQRSLQISKRINDPEHSFGHPALSSLSIDVEAANEGSGSRQSVAPASEAHRTQRPPTNEELSALSSIPPSPPQQPQLTSEATLRLPLRHRISDTTPPARTSSSPQPSLRATGEGQNEEGLLLSPEESLQRKEPAISMADTPSYAGYSALIDEDDSGRQSTEDEETKGDSIDERSDLQSHRGHAAEDDPTRSLPAASHTRRLTFEIVTDSDESMWRSLQNAPHPPNTIALSQKILASYDKGNFPKADEELLQMPAHPTLLNGGSSVSQWIVNTQSSPDLLKRRSDFIQECVMDGSEQYNEDTSCEFEPSEDDVKDVLQLWAEKAPPPVFSEEHVSIEGLGITREQPPPRDPDSLSAETAAAQAKLKLLSPIALDEVGTFQGKTPQLGDLTGSSKEFPSPETTPSQTRSATVPDERQELRLNIADVEGDPIKDTMFNAGSSNTSESSGLEDFERALQLLSPVASAPTHSPTLAHLAIYSDARKMSSRDSLAAARTLSTSVTPSPRWLSKRRTPRSQGFDLKDRRFSASNAGDTTTGIRRTDSFATISASSSRLAEQMRGLDQRRVASDGQVLANGDGRRRLPSAPSDAPDRSTVASQRSSTISLLPASVVGNGVVSGGQHVSEEEEETSGSLPSDSRPTSIRHFDQQSQDHSDLPATDLRLDEEAKETDSPFASEPAQQPSHTASPHSSSLASVVITGSPSVPDEEISYPKTCRENEKPGLTPSDSTTVSQLPTANNGVGADNTGTVVPTMGNLEVDGAAREALDIGDDDRSHHGMSQSQDPVPQCDDVLRYLGKPALTMGRSRDNVSPKTPQPSSPTLASSPTDTCSLNPAFPTSSLPMGAVPVTPSPAKTDGDDAIPSISRLIRGESFGASSAATSSIARTPEAKRFSSIQGENKTSVQLDGINAALAVVTRSPSTVHTDTDSRATMSTSGLPKDLKPDRDVALQELGVPVSASMESCSFYSVPTSTDDEQPRHSDVTFVPDRADCQDDTLHEANEHEDGQIPSDNWSQEDGQHSRESGSGSRFEGFSSHPSTADSGFTNLDERAPETPTFFFDRHLKDRDDSRPSSFRGSNYSAISSKIATPDGLPPAADGLSLGLSIPLSASASNLRRTSSLARTPPLIGDNAHEEEGDTSKAEQATVDSAATTLAPGADAHVEESSHDNTAKPISSGQDGVHRHSTADVTKDLEAMLSSIETFASTSDGKGRRWSRPVITQATSIKSLTPFDQDGDASASSLANSRSTTLPNLAFNPLRRVEGLESQQEAEEEWQTSSQAPSQGIPQLLAPQGAVGGLDEENDLEAMTQTTRQAVRQALRRSDPSVEAEAMPVRGYSMSSSSTSSSERHGYVFAGQGSLSKSPRKRPSLDALRRSSSADEEGDWNYSAGSGLSTGMRRGSSLMSPRGRFAALPPSPRIPPEVFLRSTSGSSVSGAADGISDANVAASNGNGNGNGNANGPTIGVVHKEPTTGSAASMGMANGLTRDLFSSPDYEGEGEGQDSRVESPTTGVGRGGGAGTHASLSTPTRLGEEDSRNGIRPLVPDSSDCGTSESEGGAERLRLRLRLVNGEVDADAEADADADADADDLVHEHDERMVRRVELDEDHHHEDEHGHEQERASQIRFSDSPIPHSESGYGSSIFNGDGDGDD